MSELTLRSGQWEAALRPEVGGCVSRLQRGGVPILRAMPRRASKPLQSSCFPLAPYCNRIANGRFAFAGAEIALPANHAGEPHSLHGLSWQRAWDVIEAKEGTALLNDHYDGSGPWPWAYRAALRAILDPGGLTQVLSVTNLAKSVMPAGLGLHPYFRRRPETRVQFPAQEVLLADEHNLPTGETAPSSRFADWDAGASLPPGAVDHAHAGWMGHAEIRDDLGTIGVHAIGAPHLHVFAPFDGEILCLEPVSHLPDALNRDPGSMTHLPPGCTAMVTMRITASSGA